MRNLIGYAALAGALGLGHAKVLKWSPGDEKRWSPPQETLGFMPALGMNGIAPPQEPQAPAPTSPPVLPAGALEGRGVNNNTCGYLNGIGTSSMWCPTSQFCAVNEVNSHVGCCDDTATNCNVWTTCLKSADASKFTTDNGLTLWCGFTDYPNCLTHIYAGDVAEGYTLLGCGVAQGTDKIYYTAFDESSSASSSSPSSTDTSATKSESSSSSSTRTGLLGPGATNTPPVTQSSGGGSSTPLGAIIGGAVGGVAALALIGFGIFFLVRQNNKRKANIAPATAAAAAPPSGPGSPGGPGPDPASPAGTTPAMAQHGHQSYYDPTGAGFAHLDPRASIAKPPYGFDQGVSPPASPPPPGQSPGAVYSNTPSPPPGQPGYPQQGYGQQQAGAYSPQGQYPPQTAAYAQPGQYSPQQQQQQPGQGFPFAQGQPQQQQLPYQAYNQHQPQQQQQQQQFVHELPTQRGDGEVRELAG
ncbi:hypothetical protein QBC37DRAFT_135895 [Rhypophila decipiens]|uniref:Uncharacterized protein n=1 Tax=Rhypophila decipiens TaxID=261697 RepID=A0AAN7BD05_9PEZI|nr:hypothetical protein QBC37DRAFT_135895 [Rhypophila decipiens]